MMATAARINNRAGMELMVSIRRMINKSTAKLIREPARFRFSAQAANRLIRHRMPAKNQYAP